MMSLSVLQICLLISSALFCIGLCAVMVRTNAILVLLGVELMLNAANLNFIAFWKFGLGDVSAGMGVIFVLFSIAVAAAEAAVGLALVIAIYRRQRSISLPDATLLKG